jgi:hypothetical protein
MFGRFFCDGKQLLWKLQWILNRFCCVIEVEEKLSLMGWEIAAGYNRTL